MSECRQKMAGYDLCPDVISLAVQVTALQAELDALKERCELLYCAGAEECPMEQQLAELDALKKENERARNAIHQWMQTTDQGGTKDSLIENFVGMYTYKVAAGEILNKEDKP